jgi:hypothetical protein
MKAKETIYNGYKFRSRLEATWAIFFDIMKIKYIYEPEQFLCYDQSQYTPDFYLPECYCRKIEGVYLEIKPIGWKDDNNYKKRISGAFDDDTGLILMAGDPFESIEEWSNENEQLSPFWDNNMIMMYCKKCNIIKFEFAEANYCYCPKCESGVEFETMRNVAKKARMHRFEYYEIR